MAKDYSQPAPVEAINNAHQALESNGFAVEVVDSLQAAHDRVLELIPEGAEVFTAASVTLTATGLVEELNESGRYVSARKKFMPMTDPEQAIERRRLGSASDYAIGSIQAVTEDGIAMIVSNSGSQLPNYVYGANHVIWLVGAQKVVKDMHEAIDRLEKHVFPLEDKRAQAAYGSGSIVSKLLFYMKDPQHRIRIIFIKEAVGY